MNPYVVILVIFLLYAIFVPMIFGKKWHAQYKIGYRYGILVGASSVVTVVGILDTHFKFFN